MEDALDKNPNKIVVKDDDDNVQEKTTNNEQGEEINKGSVEKNGQTEPERDTTEQNGQENQTINTEQEIVEIDGEQYTIDTDGNAVKDGKVVYTKAQIDAMSDDNGEGSEEPYVASIEDIAAKSGISIVNEQGNPVQYDMSVDGLARREMDIYKKGAQEASSKAIDEFLKANPDILNVVNYKLTYGTIEGYTSNFDYNKVTLDKDNKAQLKDIIVKAEIAKGNTPERANRIANLIEADNTLDVEAEEALNYLKARQQAAVEQNLKAAREQQEAIIEQQNRFYGLGVDEKGNTVDLNIDGSIYDIVVKKGSIKGLEIPEAGITVKTSKGNKLISRRELYNYISVPVKQIDGYWYTQAQLDDMARMNNPEDMVLNYIRNLTGDDISQLVKKAINRDKVLTVRKLTSKGSKANGTKRVGNRTDGNDKVILPIK